MKKKGRKMLAWLLTAAAVVTAIIQPMTPAAAGETTDRAAAQMAGDTDGDGVITVYFTLSEDGSFVTGNDNDETVLAHVPVEMSYFDLADYGLEEFYRYESDSFENGGEYIGKDVIEAPTLLHLYIKMLESYYLGDGQTLIANDKSQDALSISGSATSLYMTRFWGHDENLMYYVNHQYPLQAAGWGSTSDYILLEDGMEIDVAMFSDWDFYHTGAFAYYQSSDHTEKNPGEYEIETGESITLQMLAASTNAAYDGNSSVSGEPMAGESVVYARADQAFSDYTNAKWKQMDQATDENGKIVLSFDTPGVYYVSSTPYYENFKLESGNACVAPPIAVIYVTGDGGSDTEPGEDYTGELLSGVEFADGTVDSSGRYALSQTFSSDVKNYELYVPDYQMQVGAFVQPAESAPERTQYSISYTDTSGEMKNAVLDGKENLGKKLTKVLQEGIGQNTLTLRAICENRNSADAEEIYTFQIVRQATLKNLIFINKTASAQIPLTPEFSPEKKTYQTSVREDMTQLCLQPEPFLSDGYKVLVEGEEADLQGTFDAALEAEEWEKTFPITVTAEGCKETTYELTVIKKARVSETFLLTEGSILQVSDKEKKQICRYYSETERYTLEGLTEGETYTYTVTGYGYQAKNGSFQAQEDGMTDACLIKAEENTAIDAKIPALWKNFRGNDENNGITNARTANDYTNAQLYWAKKVGSGYGSGAPSSPILVDGYLVYTTATSIVKVDTVTGEVAASGDMIKTSAFNITPPTYADGMIFVALASGTIQAFNADTLESLWVYKDAYYGQPNTPITYHNGYLYTGFWSGETNKANFVCLSATDEDITTETEEKTAVWTYTSKGGFYWAGCYANNDFVLVGTDDGEAAEENGASSLLVFSPLTGELLDQRDGLNGDIRSSICCDDGKYYFSSKGGSFYQAEVSEEGKITALQELDLGGASTSTPVVYQGRAYVGVKGEEQFGVNAGHSITVIDLSNLTVAYRLKTRGYPQTSGLLTTGYEQEDGYIYVYFIDNYEPGKIRVLKDQAGQQEAIITRESEYEDANDANVLFSPKGEQANYAICSLISDEYGTMYFKNDSAYMMALGSKITSIKVTQQPDKKHYEAGETFDAAGMKVTAYYTNGMSRDVTDYVTCTSRELTLNDQDVEVRFSYVSYNDELKNYEHFDPLLDVVDITVSDEAGLAAAKQVTEAINAIAMPVTLEGKKQIAKARSGYDALDSSLEGYVDNYNVLLAAEKTYGELLTAYWAEHPAVVKAKADTYQSIQLSWGKVEYAEGYQIYRATDKKGNYQKIKTVTGTSYTDTGCAAGTTFYYKIKPYAGMGPWGKTVIAGASSVETSAKPILKTAVLSSVKSTGYNSLKISWKQVSGAQGYEVYRSTAKKGTYKKVKTILSKTIHSYKDGSLKTGTTYFYKIRAYRSINGKKVYSAWSAVKSQKPLLGQVTMDKVNAGKKLAVLHWKKVSGASGYEVFRSTKKKGTYQIVKTVSSGKTQTYTNKSLKSKKTYYFKVRAYRKIGGKKVYGSYSAVKKVQAR